MPAKYARGSGESTTLRFARVDVRNLSTAQAVVRLGTARISSSLLYSNEIDDLFLRHAGYQFR
jgi:hypothetical protein